MSIKGWELSLAFAAIFSHKPCDRIREVELYLKSRLHRAKAFAFFYIFQCGKRLHPSLLSMGDANARCKRALTT